MSLQYHYSYIDLNYDYESVLWHVQYYVYQLIGTNEALLTKDGLITS